jgi:hypothetical protein
VHLRSPARPCICTIRTVHICCSLALDISTSVWCILSRNGGVMVPMCGMWGTESSRLATDGALPTARKACLDVTFPSCASDRSICAGIAYSLPVFSTQHLTRSFGSSSWIQLIISLSGLVLCHFACVALLGKGKIRRCSDVAVG